MSRVFFLGLLASASALSLKTVPAPIAHLASADETCQWPGSSPVTALTLAEYGEMSDPEADVKTYQDAVVTYKAKAQAFETAKANFLNSSAALEFQAADTALMEAGEALLETPAADTAMLSKAVAGEFGKDTLVAFYAPWCPHCKTFVLHDEAGNPKNAPLENLRKDMAKDQNLKDVAVYRADVTKLGENGIPAPLVVQGIPTMYFINAQGAATQFQGNAHDLPSVKAFVGEVLASR